jgi:hypothetical protein
MQKIFNKALMSTLFTALLLTGVTDCDSKSVNTTSTSGSNTGSPQKTFFSVYMVGSDLEDDVNPRNGTPDEKDIGTKSLKGAGTNDLNELISGYENLSNNEKSNIDILVAFGGARKEGWQGVKYADISCLQKDSEDGYFGNDSCYSFSDKSANLGEQKSLQKFFETVKTKANGFGKKISIIWDHGNAYNGVGLDTNYDDLLFLPEINKAFENSGLKVDIIGFDACLMASLEVAKTVNKYSDFLIGSEELEPGHGWNYTDIISFIGKTPSATITDIGKKVVDSFIDSEKHLKSRNKTLSLLNLKETENLIKKVDQLVINSNDASFHNVLESLDDSEKFGEGPHDIFITSIDLKSFAKNILKLESSLSSPANQIISSLNQFIVYSRHDIFKPDSNGISVFSLDKELKKSYNSEISVSNDFLNFTDRFINYETNTTSKPEISTVDMETKQFSAKQLIDRCTHDGKEGHCLKISDNAGLKRVEQVFGVNHADGKTKLLGTKHLKKFDTHDDYFFEDWDGRWFSLCDGTCTGNNVIIPSAYFEELTEDGNAVYTSEAKIFYKDLGHSFDAEVYFEVKLDDKGEPVKVIDEWIVPLGHDKEGHLFLSKEQDNFEDLLEDGPYTIEFYYLVVDEKAGKEELVLGDKLLIHSKPEWKLTELHDHITSFVEAEDFNGNLVSFVVAEDYNGNLAFSEKYSVNFTK